MAQKSKFIRGRRVRIFGGPNGSGKTTILKQIDSNFDVGFYINADEIESEIRNTGVYDLSKFGVSNPQAEKLQKQILKHSIYKKAVGDGFEIDIEIKGTVVHNPNNETHSYEASLLADIIRNFLLSEGRKFSFETVMSHKSKADFLKSAAGNGYKNYLYFVSTESPLINIDRVRQRVELGGHPVNEEKIEQRYHRSLELLSKAIPHTYRSFIFDNSGKEPLLIMEVYKGMEIEFKHGLVPAWVDEHIISKMT